MAGHSREVRIDRLGAQGDGVVESERVGEAEFVTGALPGERWRLAPGAAPERLSDGPGRASPICRHFGTCGGCRTQHMSAELYQVWKREILTTALAHRGLDVPVAPLRTVTIASRRRAQLGVRHQNGRVEIGFREEGQHALVDLAECPVLMPRLVALIPHLREIARRAVPDGVGGRLVVTLTDAGPDVAFGTGKARLTAGARAEIARLAAAAGIARLMVDSEPVAMLARPTLTFGGVAVEPPANSFLQASAEAEAILTELVLAGVGRAKRIADLFSGVGTFTFPLARNAQVLAIDGDKPAIEALELAARHAQGVRKVATKVRDLFREPLSPLELKDFSAVVVDPPRAGAKAQVEALARSKVPVVVMVSCSPATLARDLRLLSDGGFAVDAVTPVDQFVFTPHLEAVAVLSR